MKRTSITVIAAACVLAACGRDSSPPKPAAAPTATTAAPAPAPAPVPPPASDSYMPGANVGAAPETPKKEEPKK
jgi:hypothetical protein